MRTAREEAEVDVDIVHPVVLDDLDEVVNVAVPREANRLALAVLLQLVYLSDGAVVLQAGRDVALDVDAVDRQHVDVGRVSVRNLLPADGLEGLERGLVQRALVFLVIFVVLNCVAPNLRLHDPVLALLRLGLEQRFELRLALHVVPRRLDVVDANRVAVVEVAVVVVGVLAAGEHRHRQQLVQGDADDGQPGDGHPARALPVGGRFVAVRGAVVDPQAHLGQEGLLGREDDEQHHGHDGHEERVEHEPGFGLAAAAREAAHLAVEEQMHGERHEAAERDQRHVRDAGLLAVRVLRDGVAMCLIVFGIWVRHILEHSFVDPLRFGRILDRAAHVVVHGAAIGRPERGQPAQGRG